MSDLKEIICITCPKGCQADVWTEDGTVKVKGKICKKGREYLQQEFIEPLRILTSTVVVEHSRFNRLPVRTSKPIPKKVMTLAMDPIARVKVEPPISIGDVIIQNLCDTGVELIASDDLLD